MISVILKKRKNLFVKSIKSLFSYNVLYLSVL